MINQKDNKNIAVVGAGGWGTALAMVLSENFDSVIVWTRNEDQADEINLKRTNSKYLTVNKIPSNVVATTNPDDIKDIKFLVNSVPTQYIREYYQKYNINLKDKYIINSSKGVENNSNKTISGIFEEVYIIDSNHFAVLTGPSHAEEVILKVPTTVVVASDSTEFAKKVQEIFFTNYFRVYTSDDVIGCEIGGSLKNVIAIAAGIVDGMGLGDNTKAALLTRGLAEIARLGEAMGAKHQTFSGLSGLGDLFVTCNSKHSRNRSIGERIGNGENVSTILANSKTIAEGVFTSKSAYNLSQKYNIEMPITTEVYKTIFENKDPRKAIDELMKRDAKNEWYS
ncbi:MAG: NAD(P)H-dependent glycerol-3-phosphate dehydrogenase [Candidatus Kapaibacterium sp.]